MQVGFFVYRKAKASPFGRGVCAADGEGKPGMTEPTPNEK